VLLSCVYRELIVLAHSCLSVDSIAYGFSGVNLVHLRQLVNPTVRVSMSLAHNESCLHDALKCFLYI
jgi:hypothetical protein